MKTYKEIAENALRARDEYLAKKKRRNDMMKKVGAVVLAVAIAIGAGFMIKNMLDAGKDVSVAAEPGGNKDGKAIYEINGVTLAAVDRDTDEYKRLDPEGKFWVFKDSNGLIFYTNADIQFRMISNTDPQNTKISNDPEQMVDYLLKVVGMETDREDVSGSWSENSYSKEYRLVQNTQYGEILLADVFFDDNDVFVTGNFNPDGYYNGTDSILPQDKMIEIALGYVKDVFGEEYYEALLGRYKIDIIPVYAFKGELRCNILFENTDEDPFYAGGIWSNGCEIIINAITGEFRQSGY